MLATETRFPWPGSYAILNDGGRAAVARIHKQHRNFDGEIIATVTVEGRDGSSGVRGVPLAELQDPTPLTPEEESELLRLHADIGDGKAWADGRTKAARAARARFAELTLRRINAETLAALRAKQRRAA